MNCFVCSIHFDHLKIKKTKSDRYKKTGRWYCSSECAKQFAAKISRISLSNTNKKYASNRMKINNPTFKEDVKEKIKKTKLKNGTFHNKPIIQGGNGREPPKTVQMLNKIINWEVCYIVRTGTRVYYPTHYKLELAKPEKKIYIEIDGASAYSRKEQAEKKADFMKKKGWKLIRFKNNEVLHNLDECIEIVREVDKEEKPIDI
jgi:hypothetical protein